MLSAVKLPVYTRSGAVRAYALVDVADAAWLSQWRWHLYSGRYAAHWEWRNGRLAVITMHREILGLPHSRDGRECDHINRDGLDNRRVNLRVVTHAENHQNRPAARNARSRFRGVYWDTTQNRWRAEVSLNGKKYRLGRFADEAEAGQAVSTWRSVHMPFAVEVMS